MNFEKFREEINLAIKDELDRAIPEICWPNAVATSTHLFEQALAKKEEVKIISSVLNEHFFLNFRKIAEELIKNGLSVKAIALNPMFKAEKNSFAELISKSKPQCDLTIAPMPKKDGDDVRHPHFILVGKKKYRLETSHSQGKAITNFNDPIIGQYLFDLFDALLNSYKKNK